MERTIVRLTENENEQCNVQIETSTESQHEQHKAKTNNQSLLPVSVFKIELILSQKQQATKSSKKQGTANGNTHQKPKRATKSIFHSHFHSFASTLDVWKVVSKAMKSQKEQQRATKSSKKQRRAAKSNKKQKRTSELENQNGKLNKKPKRATKGTKSPHGNQALKGKPTQKSSWFEMKERLETKHFQSCSCDVMLPSFAYQDGGMSQISQLQIQICREPDVNQSWQTVSGFFLFFRILHLTST